MNDRLENVGEPYALSDWAKKEEVLALVCSNLSRCSRPELPHEAYALQLADPLGRHSARPALRVQLVLPALALDPGGQLHVGLVAGRDEAVAVLSLVAAKVLNLLAPCRLVGVPNETEGLEELTPLGRHGGLLALLHELVLAALALDPSGELWVGRVSVGYEGVPVLLAEGSELEESFVPLLLVEGTEAWRGSVGVGVVGVGEGALDVGARGGAHVRASGTMNNLGHLGELDAIHFGKSILHRRCIAGSIDGGDAQAVVVVTRG